MSCGPCCGSWDAGGCIRSGTSSRCSVRLSLLVLRHYWSLRPGAPVRRTGAYTDWRSIGLFFLSTVIIVGLFEEVGWRGFALPRLQLRLDAIWAALVLGVLWALGRLEAHYDVESVTLLSTVELLILRRPSSLTSPYAVRSRTTRPSLK